MMRNRRVWLLVFFAMTSLWACRGAIPMKKDSTWKWVTPLPEGRTRLKAFMVPDGYIQVIGGVLKRDAEEPPTSLENPDKIAIWPNEKQWFLIYDIFHDNWTTSPIRLDPVSDFLRLCKNAAVVRDARGDFYWIGGTKKESESTAQLLKVEQGVSFVADSQKISETLVELPPMQEAREQHGAVQTLDGKILVMGGVKCYIKTEIHGSNISSWEASEPLNSVECFDLVTSSWKSRAAMIHPRLAFAAVVLQDGKVIVCGGVNGNLDSYDGSSRALAAAELYDPVLDRWQELSPMPQPRLSHAATLAPDGRVWVIGGVELVHKRTNYANLSFTVQRTVFIYDPKSDRWTLGPEMHISRRDCAAVCTPDGRLYAIGGSNYGLYKTRSVLGLAVPLRHMAGDILADVEMLDIAKWSAGK